MRLRTKLTTAFLLVLIPVAALQAYGIYRDLRAHEEAVLKAQLGTTRTLASAVEAFVGELASRGMAAAHDLQGRRLTSASAAAAFSKFRRRTASPTVYALVDAEGRLVATDPPAWFQPGVNVADRRYFKALVAGESWAVSSLLLSRLDRRPTWALATAIRDGRDRLRGAVIYGLSPAIFDEVLPRDMPPGSLSLFDRNGRKIWANGLGDLPWDLRDHAGDASVARALAGEEAEARRFPSSLDGTERMGVVVPVRAIGWAAGVSVSRRQAIAPAHQAARRQALVLGALVALSGGLAYLFGRRIGRPLERLTAAAERLAAGAVNEPIPVRGGDELARLGHAFNRMVESLAASRREVEARAQEATARASLLESLHRTAEGLLSEVALDPLLEQIADHARRLADARYAALAVVDAEGRLTRFIPVGIDPAARAQLRDPPRGLGLLAAALKERRPVRSENILIDPRAIGFPEGHPLMRTFLGVPILLKGEVLGELYLTEKERGASFTGRDEEILLIFAHQAALAIERAGTHEQTRRDAEAKAALLRELNHRVRNNLASIVTLLTLERERRPDPAVAEALEESIGRVQSLARIHDLLMEGGMDRLRLRHVVASLAQGLPMRLGPRGCDVLLEIKGADPSIPLRPMTALALILNELLTNTAKHAFVGRTRGRIEVLCTETEDRITVQVRDDGIGPPPGGFERPGGIGREIVTTLAHTDLAGECSWRADGGTVATVTFPTGGPTWT